ncbi:MAG: pilus assembly protein CpaE [Chloroflexota bacterium]|nr:pilus assembly protein CpaE [Chloroflexota bacterium]
MEGRRAPQGLDVEDKLALGLSASHLAYLLLFWLAGYALLTSRLPAFVSFPVGLLMFAVGAALAWGRYAHRPVDEWVWLWLRYRLRPRGSAPRPVIAMAPQPRGLVLAEPAPNIYRADDSGDAELDEDAGPRILSLPGASLDTTVEHDRGASYDAAPDQDDPPNGEAPVFLGGTQRVVFFSTKGGVGKTTLATEVASLLARDGRQRAAPEAAPAPLKVALLDVDMGSANISMKLGLTHPTLWDLVLDPNPAADQLEACLLEHEESGLRVLLGPPRAIAGNESRSLAIQRIAQVLGHLDDNGYHFVFMDMSSDINEVTTYLLEAAHVIYYVVTPTAAGVQDTYRGVETLRRLGHRRKLRFVVNQARGDFDASEMLADLGGSLAASVARDDAFLEAEDEHRPAALGGGAARRSVAALAATIYPTFAEPRPRRSVWRRLVRRLG